MFTNGGKVRTEDIVENAVTICTMAFILDVRVQSCMGIPERTVYAHFKRMQKEKNYKTDYGTYKMRLLKKVGNGDDRYFSLSPEVLRNGMLDRYDLQKYHDFIKGEKSTGSNKQGKRKSKRISLAVAVMHGAGAHAFPGQKKLPMINSIENKQTDLIFYTSREARALDESKQGQKEDNEIQYGQYDGFLIAPHRNYIVYVVDKWVFRFNVGAERRTQQFGSRKFSKLIGSPSDRFMDAIFILRSERFFEDMLRRGEDEGDYKKYRIGGLFFSEHCIPLYKVKEILPIIVREDHRHIIRKTFFPRAKKVQTFDYRDSFDGHLSRDEVILSVLDCDLPHIERAMAYVKKICTLKCVVLCFDWQRPYLTKVFGKDRIAYKEMTYEAFLQNMKWEKF